MADGQPSKNPFKGRVKGLLGRQGLLPIREGGPSSTPSAQSRPLSPAPPASSDTPTTSANDAAATSSQTAQNTIAQQLWDEAITRIRSSKEHQGVFSAINDQLMPAVHHDAAAYSGTVPALVKDIADNLAAKSQRPRSKQRWVFDHAIGLLNKFMIVGDVAVNFDPVHAALPWAAVRFVLLNVTAGIELDNKTLEGVALVTSLFARCGLYQSLYLSTDFSTSSPAREARNTLKRATVDVYFHSLVFLGYLIQTRHRSRASRTLTAAFSVNVLDGCLQSLKDSERALLQRGDDLDKLAVVHLGPLQQQSLGLLKDMTQLHKKLEHFFDIMSEDRLFSQLKPVEAAAYDHVDSQIVTCHVDTRVDLLKQIHDWAHASDRPPIFWLSGLAGTGKSTISRTVAQRLDGDCLGGSFFFKRGGGDRSHARRFFPTLAYQLACMLPWWYEQLLKTLSAEPGIITKDIRKQFAALIQKPLEEESNIPDATSARSLVVVIDALDECDASDIRLVIKLLISTNLRCFITTRPEYNVRSFFRTANESHELVVLHHVDQQTTQNDIQVYIKSRMAHFRTEYNDEHDHDEDAVLADDWPGDSILRKLAGLALPLFISAATICRMIEDPDWILSPDERIQDILSTRERGHDTLDGIYTQVLGRLNLRGEASSRFRDIVGSVVLLFDSLDSKSLSSLIQTDKRSVDACLDPLHSVLDIANPSAPIKLFHLSFRDFLLGEAAPAEYRVDEKYTHARLARLCCQVLLKGLRKDMCDIKSPGKSRTEIDDRLIREKLSPQLQYAAVYWAGHLTSGGLLVETGDAFHQLLRTKFLMWLEALSLVDKMSSVFGLIDQLMLAVHPQTGSEVMEFLRDARRFALYFGSIVQQHPLQVYHTTHVFAPKNSAVRIAFADAELSDWIRRSGDVGPNWTANLRTFETQDRRLSTCVAFSRDGKVASGTANGTIHAWNTTSGDELFSVGGLEANVTAVCFAPNGYLATVLRYDERNSSSIKVWDTDDKPRHWTLATIDGVSVDYLAVGKKHDRLSALSKGGQIYMYDLSSGECVQKHVFPATAETTAALSGRGAWFAFSDQTSVNLGRWQGSQKVRSRKVMDIGDEVVRGLAFSNDEAFLGVGYEHSVTIWDIKTGTCIHTLRSGKFRHAIAQFAFTKNHAAVGTIGGALSIWDLRSKAELHIPFAHTAAVQALVFSPDNEVLASASLDFSVKTWDLQLPHTEDADKKGQRIGKLRSFGHQSELLAAKIDRSAEVWNVQTGQTVRVFPLCDALATSKEKLLLANAIESTINIWDAEQWSIKMALEADGNEVSFLAFSENGLGLVSIASRWPANEHKVSKLQVWNTNSGHEDWSLLYPAGWEEPQCAAIFLSESERLIAVVDSVAVEIYDMRTSRQRSDIFLQGIESIVFLNDGAFILAVTRTRLACAYETSSGAMVWQHIITADFKGDLFQRALNEMHQSYGQGLPSPTQRLNMSSDGRWVMKEDEKLLWIPPQYRPISTSISGAAVSFGAEDGMLSILGYKGEV